MFSSLLYVVLAIVILSIIVVCHEFGHYVVGRLTGIRVLEFAVGMGPKVFGWTRKGIDYSFRAFPLGGFCRFKGEEEEDCADPDSFYGAPVWKRFLTVLCGPLMNFALAFLAMVILMSINGWYESVPSVHSVIEGTPAHEAGLMAGDIITAVDGEPIAYSEQGMARVQAIIAGANEGFGIDLAVDRGDERVDLTIVPAYSEELQKLQIGIYFGSEHHRFAADELVPEAMRYLADMSTMMLDALKNLFFKGEGLNETMGPVGIISTVSTTVQQGFSQTVTQGFAVIFNMLVIISLNLGIMNLLPVPPLDGGHLVLMIVEMIRRKPTGEKVRMAVQGAGVLFMLFVFVFFTWQDIVRLIFG